MTASAIDKLKDALNALRKGFYAVVVFSFAVNVLMLASPLYMLQIYDRVLTSRSMDTLMLLTLLVVFALLTLAALEAVRTSLMVRMSIWLDQKLAGSMLTASIINTLRTSSDANVQGLRDLTTLRTFLTGPGVFPVLDAPWAPIYLIIIYYLHPVLGIVALIGAIVLLVIAIANELMTRKLLAESGSATITALNQANAATRNADVIEAMGLMPNLIRRWDKINGQSLALQAKASHRSGLFSAASKFIRLVLQTAMLGGGAYYAIIGEMTPGGMIAASILVGRALSPVEQAINSWRSGIAARNAIQRIKQQLMATPLRGQAMPLPAPEGEVQVEKLSFAFPGMRKPTIHNVSFELETGDALGLIGPSASGKTTLGRLLLGNLVPMSGHARLDGMDMAEWEPEDRGQYVGYLPQDIELFQGSIKENIARMGEGDPEQVIQAAQLAGVHEIIVRLPEGYETQIGEGGAALSGGQRQRIALARALYGNPRLVVLDEPAASLDRDGEAALLVALKALQEKGITTIVIAHRPAILECVNKMLVLQDGAISSFGPKQEVLSQLQSQAPAQVSR